MITLITFFSILIFKKFKWFIYQISPKDYIIKLPLQLYISLSSCSKNILQQKTYKFKYNFVSIIHECFTKLIKITNFDAKSFRMPVSYTHLVFSMANDNCRKFKQNLIIFCIQPRFVEFSRPIVFGEDRLRERGSLPATFYVLTRVKYLKIHLNFFKQW